MSSTVSVELFSLLPSEFLRHSITSGVNSSGISTFGFRAGFSWDPSTKSGAKAFVDS